ncbi:PAS domain-containing protein [Fischerella sp. JS2]|uniref:PAS domain-containing protein n=1 Tax=Fischerella sp. JS2 TaxID=2597771 RepID=UPI0028E5E854|nr:PAS domain-containing protein [Fischerella sp. JS2]
MVDIIDKSTIDQFAKKTQVMDQRIAKLYEKVMVMPVPPNSVPQALFELGNASQTIHHAVEELYQQNEQLEQVQEVLGAEYLRYEELFEEAPDGYLVTDAHSKIRLANHKAVRLLNIDKNYLVGKAIVNFIHLEERQYFRNFLSQLSQAGRNQELLIRLQRRNGELFNAALTVAASYDNQGKIKELRWLIRGITESRRVELVHLKKECDFSDRPIHSYPKGEIIPLNPQRIWYISQGLVKLTTLSESGEEVLVGLADQGMVFGSYMTSLNTYQATAMSDTKLISIYVSEIIDSPNLSHILLPKLNQRLRQTESFLAVSGLRRVQDRIYYLLRILKQEFGEKVGNETRLCVRLTHEDLANACCTTRVTITRLLCKLKHQGKISFDSKRHIIIKDID